ncbi:MAG: Ig-like domain-containing protein, partial [Acidobacteriota bacterium]
EVFASGDQVYVRVVSHSVNDPGAIDVVDVSLLALDSLDMEQVLLNETGLDTAVFEGSIALGSSFSSYDGTLDASSGDQIEATREPFTGTGPTAVDYATVVGSATFFVDASGQLASRYLQASEAFLRVIDHNANYNPGFADNATVQVAAEITGDYESLNLIETGPDTGVFTGTLDLAVGPGSPTDGVLHTDVDPGLPIPFDTLVATYLDGFSQSQATARTFGSLLAFIDGSGVEVSVVENGLDARLRVEDHAANNNPGSVNSVMATVYASSTGDQLDVFLIETGADTAVFEGVFTLQDNPVADNFDGLLQTQLGDTILASYSDAYGSFSSHAEATVIVPTNLPPSVDLTSPADSSVFVSADSIAFAATASDPEDGDLSASLVWTSDLDGAIGSGGSFSANLSIGTHVITAAVTDSGGRSAEASVAIQVDNTEPVPTINSPADGANFGADVAVELSATATDFDDGDVTASIQWFSDRDGNLGTGGTIFRILTEGAHVITAVATDSAGFNGYASVNITIDPANTAPTVTIVTPAGGSTFVTVDAIAFSAVADDIEDGDLAASLSWTSDLDGAIGSGASFTANLSQGAHVITASVTDSGGLTGFYVANITVDNTAPTAAITAPADGTTVNAGASVTLTGTASDYDEGDLTASLSWSSDLDGALGSGGSVTTSSLSAGTHVITASVSDAGGLTASDTITLTVNAGPSASITAPADGTTVNAGDSVTLTGTASDPEDGDLTVSLSWSSDLDGALGSGGSVTTSSLSAGTHVITASVSDAGGLTASDTITLTVNAGPSVGITAPADGTTVNAGDSVTFTGTASDPEDGDLTASLSWSSDLDGVLGSGGSVTTSLLSAGTHVITASVSDAGGLSASDTITLTVNAGPSASITAPANGSTANAGSAVTFTGTASDPEDGDLSASLSWTSSLDGAIGSGASFATSSLSAGVHVITASVTDAGGLPASAAITLTVNAAPSAGITAPADGSIFDQGDSVTFTGTASDPEDGDLTASLSWSSSLDGAIGTGGSFSTSSLSLGTHVITASVVDSGGLTAVASITLTVKLPPVTVTFTSIGAEDGWVRESNETSNVGGARNNTGAGSSALRPGDQRRDRQYKAIVSFDTSSIPAGATILSADLRLQRGKVTGTNPFTTHGTCWVDIQTGAFSGSNAIENSDFQAAATASQVASLSNPPSNGDWSEGSLNAAGLAAINDSGRTQLRIFFDLDDNDDSGNDYMGYYSGDNSNSSRHPQLVVTYQP